VIDPTATLAESKSRNAAVSRDVEVCYPFGQKYGRPAVKRRAFLTLIGGAAAWPLATRAQQPGKLPTIGVFGSDASAWRSWVAAFTERLGSLGWIDGRTITIEYRWWEGRPERAAEIAAEFVRQNVDVIVATGLLSHS
jgi:putative tryptophan/tyrosine transport system substrate-binding protein